MNDDKAILVGIRLVDYKTRKAESVYMTKPEFINVMTADGNVTVEEAADDWDAMEKMQAGK